VSGGVESESPRLEVESRGCHDDLHGTTTTLPADSGWYQSHTTGNSTGDYFRDHPHSYYRDQHHQGSTCHGTVFPECAVIPADVARCAPATVVLPQTAHYSFTFLNDIERMSRLQQLKRRTTHKDTDNFLVTVIIN
jgi:hypothetical protein